MIPPESSPLSNFRGALKKTARENLLQSSESKLFLRSLAESLTASRHSFQEDFFTRYITSVSGAEDQIVASANHIVYGRRGAGKSSLLLYAMKQRESPKQLSVWIDMQIYAHRKDLRVVIDVINEIVTQIMNETQDHALAEPLLQKLKDLSEADGDPSEQSI
jgi:Cdc6-like AAA superfamily ATPase